MLAGNGALAAAGSVAQTRVGLRPPRSGASRFRSRPAGRGEALAVVTIATAAVLLTAGFGDGIAFGLMATFGIASPWLFLFPPLFGGLAYCWLRNARPGREYLIECYLMLVFMVAALTLQSFVFAELNLFGLLQLITFIIVLVLLQGVFANAPAWLSEAFPRAMRGAHYFLCGCVVIAFLAWHLLGIDLSLVKLLNPAGTDAAFTSFRPTGFSKEPQWAAFALGASYIGVYLLFPAERLRALLAMSVVAVLLQSGTLLLFSGLYGAAVLWQTESSVKRTASVILVALALTAQVTLFWGRTSQVLDVRDASLLQRVSSGSVAWSVVEESFPLGVGYGNFRDAADYSDPRWNRFLDLNKAQFYKSDFVLLNFMAELGVLSLVILVWLFQVLARGGSVLPLAFYGLTLVLSGTLLLPSLLVVAAITGALISQKRAAAEARPAISSGSGALRSRAEVAGLGA
ncbi:MAG TPA: hypothetical protein VI759_01625 [Dehalococcoidia bacterium]|nr:hypothetical protein [Dehalococcoidia bacterium]